MIPSTQVANTEIVSFIAVLVFKLLSCKILLTNRKDNKNLATFLENSKFHG